MSDIGWQMRADLLRANAERSIADPLKQHGWSTEIERVEKFGLEGEYAIVVATRNGLTRRAALLYSCASGNSLYQHLEKHADATFYNGQPYNLEQYAYGLSKAVRPLSEFHHCLLDWNKDSVPGKLVPVAEATQQNTAPPLPRERRLISETPIDAVWARLARLQSATLARKALTARADAEGYQIDAATAQLKSEGVAYAIRTAGEYFSLKGVGSVSQRVLNLYYGCLSFAFAEMLAVPDGPPQLSQLEDITKQGHGLWTCDGLESGFGGLAIGPLATGFFRAWTRSFSCGDLLTSAKKPKTPEALLPMPADSWATLEQLFARIPEVGDLFEDVFLSAPAWITPAYDSLRNISPAPTILGGNGERPKISYVLLIDDSGRLTAEEIAKFPGPIREISKQKSGTRAAHFRAAIDHPDHEYWWQALTLHHSPFERNSMILPLFGNIQEYRAICVAILYALSILVRYRISLWRRIQEGDLDHVRALIEAFLGVVERVLPERFLESITKEEISIHQPGSFYS